MAAGSGSRYGKLKQFDELGPKDEFLMEFSIFDAIENGFNHIVVITKAENKSFLTNYLTQRLPKHVALDVLAQNIKDLPKQTKLQTERIKPWGTAHAVWTARHVITSEFVIINADDYYGKPAFVAASNFIKNSTSHNTYGIVAYSLKDTLSEHGAVSRGICTDDEGKLISIEEHTKIQNTKDGLIVDQDSGKTLDPNTLVSMNFWICNAAIFDYIETYFSEFLKVPQNLEKSEIYLPFVAQEMMSNGLVNITIIPSHSDWFGVTYYDDKASAVTTLAALTKSKKYPSPLWV